jgi:hypothetical protein
MSHPEWVDKYKGKGTSVKKIGESYYLYKVTSVREKGKKHPVSRQIYIGKVTENGVENAGVRIVPGETEGTILENLIPEVDDELGKTVLIRTDGGWMYTKTNEEKKEKLKKLGLYEYGFLPKEISE